MLGANIIRGTTFNNVIIRTNLINYTLEDTLYENFHAKLFLSVIRVAC